MIKNLNEDTALKFKTLSAEEKAKRGILGRLYGPIADCINPTRNQRKYSQDLWERIFDSPLIQERFKNGGIFGQLCHPDYSEVDIEKVAVVMPEPPVKDRDGRLVAYLDIVDTPCGRIAYQLAKYGYKFGISSRGEGDLIADADGNESVDPETYTLYAFDLVEIPAVYKARMELVTESLNKKKDNKTLKESLQESLDKANEDERKLMEDALNSLDIHLDEEAKVDEEVMDEMAENSRFYYLVKLEGTTIRKIGLLTADKRLSPSDREEFARFKADGKEIKLLNRDGLNISPKKLGMEYLIKYKNRHDLAVYADLSIKDVVAKGDEDNIIFTRLNTVAEADALDPEQIPVYINGRLNHEWFDNSRRYEVNEAIENGEVVVKYTIEHGHRPTTVPETFLLKESLEHEEHESLVEDIFEEGAGTAVVAAKFVANNLDKIIDGLKELGVAANDIDKDIVDIIKRHKDLKNIKDESLDEAKRSDVIRYQNDVMSIALQILKDAGYEVTRAPLSGDVRILCPNTKPDENWKKEVKSKLENNGFTDISSLFVRVGNDERLWLDIDWMHYNKLNDIKDESLNINEEKNMAVDNNEAIVEELQEALKSKSELESKVIELQEKLSVCYAKEAKIDEEVSNYKASIRRLSESTKQVVALNAKIKTLENNLSVSKQNEVELNEKLSKVANKAKSFGDAAVSLKESVTQKSTELEGLRKSVTSLTEELATVKAKSEAKEKSLKENSIKELATLKEQFEKEKATLNESIAQLQENSKKATSEYSQKLEKSNKLVEKYKKATTTAVNKYIELQAVRLGATANEIKNRLPESYSFNDIDAVCESLQEYKLNMSRLPINAIAKKPMSESITIKGVSSKNEVILPANNLDDDIDEDLMYLAGK